jgi:hypothetical protein
VGRQRCVLLAALQATCHQPADMLRCVCQAAGSHATPGTSCCGCCVCFDVHVQQLQLQASGASWGTETKRTVGRLVKQWGRLVLRLLPEGCCAAAGRWQQVSVCRPSTTARGPVLVTLQTRFMWRPVCQHEGLLSQGCSQSASLNSCLGVQACVSRSNMYCVLPLWSTTPGQDNTHTVPPPPHFYCYRQ